MKQLGILRPQMYDNTEELIGEIKTLQYRLKVRFTPNQHRPNGNEPHYLVFAMSFDGEDIQVGAAWKINGRNSQGDMEYLSTSIDEPSLPFALNVAAFKQNDGTYMLSWRRRQDSKSQQQNERA